MSDAEFDLSVRITPEQIRRRSFAKVRRGFDPDQVRDYMHEVADEMKRLEEGVREAQSEADAANRGLAARSDAYEVLSSRMAEVLRSADQHAEQARREAEEEAERILSEARQEADRLTGEARATADANRRAREQALQEARKEADRALAELASRRDTLLEQLQAMRESLLGTAKGLGPADDAPELAGAGARDQQTAAPRRLD